MRKGDLSCFGSRLLHLIVLDLVSSVLNAVGAVATVSKWVLTILVSGKGVSRLILVSVLAHLIDFYQMCYCYRKLGNLTIFNVFLGGRGIALPGVRERPIGLPHGLSLRTLRESRVGGRGRPSTASHYKVMWSVWESEVRGRVGGWSASHAQRAMLSDPQLNALLRPVEVRLARCVWEADQPPTRPLTSDSQTDHMTHRSDSLTDLTLWQIWQIRLILAKLSYVP